MASSALELYEKAYRLHYMDGKIVEACSFYKEIIKNFPDSNEAGYSVIQLEKVGAQDIVNAIEKAHSPSHLPLWILSIVSLAAVAVLAGLLMGMQSSQELAIKRLEAQIAVLKAIPQSSSSDTAGR